MYTADGTKIETEFRDGIWHGKRKITHPDGNWDEKYQHTKSTEELIAKN